MKPLYQPKEDIHSGFLRRKWGFTNANTNAAIERTHHEILKLVDSKWDSLKDDKSKFCTCDACKEHPRLTQKEYFIEKKRWEEKWYAKKKEEGYFQGSYGQGTTK